jgi:hypothetical protein
MLPLSLRRLMIATDAGFVAYWLITLARVLPPEWLFKDYDNPILQSWNWSFLPLDLFVSASGFLALTAQRRGDARAAMLALVSLTLTSCSGLMAVAFWTLRADWSVAWWVPNLFLLLYPLPALSWIIARAARATAPDTAKAKASSVR